MARDHRSGFSASLNRVLDVAVAIALATIPTFAWLWTGLVWSDWSFTILMGPSVAWCISFAYDRIKASRMGAREEANVVHIHEDGPGTLISPWFDTETGEISGGPANNVIRAEDHVVTEATEAGRRGESEIDVLLAIARAGRGRVTREELERFETLAEREACVIRSMGYMAYRAAIEVYLRNPALPSDAYGQIRRLPEAGRWNMRQVIDDYAIMQQLREEWRREANRAGPNAVDNTVEDAVAHGRSLDARMRTAANVGLTYEIIDEAWARAVARVRPDWLPGRHVNFDDLDARNAAIERAEKVLAERLTEAELRQVRMDQHLDIPSRLHPGRIYRVPKCRGGTVRIWVKDRWRPKYFCLQPGEWVPDADFLLMHKLRIEGDEERWLQEGNWI